MNDKLDNVKLQYRKNCKDYSVLLEEYKFCDKKDCDYKTGFYGYGCFCRYKDFKEGEMR